MSWTGSCITTESHRYQKAPSLDLATWPHCLLLALIAQRLFARLRCLQQVFVSQLNLVDSERHLRWTWQLDHTVCYLHSLHSFSLLDWSVINRYMDFNPITLLEIGAFTGLGNLTTLFVTWICDAKWKCASLECREQVPEFQPNRIDSQRGLHWTWQPDYTVCYFNSLCHDSMLNWSVINRYMNYNPITLIEIGAFSSLSKLASLYFHFALFAFLEERHIFNWNHSHLDTYANTQSPFNMLFGTDVPFL